MRRLITYFNSLFLGVILGMIFVAIVHTPPSRRHAKVCANGITIGNEIFGSKIQTKVLLIAGTTVKLAHLPAEFCAYLGNQGCQASCTVIARSAYLVRSCEVLAGIRPQEVGSAPSVRPMTAAAMQLPTTFIIVRPMSISVSTPRMSRIGAVGR